MKTSTEIAQDLTGQPRTVGRKQEEEYKREKKIIISLLDRLVVSGIDDAPTIELGSCSVPALLLLMLGIVGVLMSNARSMRKSTESTTTHADATSRTTKGAPHCSVTTKLADYSKIEIRLSLLNT
jgi:hypothetical protein